MKRTKLIFLSVIAALCCSIMPSEAAAQTRYIIYHDDAGNVITSEKWVEGYTFSITSPAFFVENSYVNSGWSTAPGGSGTVYRDGDAIPALSSNLNVYAVLQRGYWISFDSKGGSPVDGEIVYEGQTSVKPADPSRSGYVFAGWEKDGAPFSFGGTISSDILLTAKWTPTSADYVVRIWVENANHPTRASLSEAIANANSDYSFKASYTKSGVPGTDVSIISSDHSRDIVKEYTYFMGNGLSFPIYFCDDNYGSKALSMTNASVEAANANGGISDDGATIVDVYYRSLVYDFTLSDGGVFGLDPYNVLVRPGEIMRNAFERSGVTVDTRFMDILTVDMHTRGCNYTMTEAVPSIGYSVSGEALYWDDAILNLKLLAEATTRQISDGIKVEFTLVAREKGEHEFVRAYYYQTLESAKSGRTLEYEDTIGNYTLGGRVVYYRDITKMYDGCMVDVKKTGFTLFFHQVKSDRADLANYTKLYARNGQSTRYYLTTKTDKWTGISCDPGYTTGIFSYLPYKNTTTGQDNGKWKDVQYKLRIFYKRDAYILSFVTGTTRCSVSPISVFYEDSFRNQAAKVVYSDASGSHPFVVDQTAYTDNSGVVWVFKGWYDNEAFVGSPVDFATTTMTMPAAAVQMYAKWEKKQIRVTYDAGAGTVGGSSSFQITMDSGTVPSNLGEAVPPIGMNFYCWTYKGSKFDFTKPLYDDAVITARYYNDKTYTLSYSAGTGSGKAPVDADKYLVNANAVVADPGSELLPPSWKKFECWKDKNGVLYYPGDQIAVSANTVLTAVYAEYLMELTIESSGMKPGHSSIFTVCAEGSSTPVSTVVITADSTGKGSAVIAEVTSGRYTVTETPWNWTYSSTVNRALNQDLEENNVFKFGSVAKEGVPANDEKSANNWHE